MNKVLKITKFHKDLVPEIDDYSAYVYRITIIFPDGTKKTYIGAHKGSIYDSYTFSTENPKFLEDLKKYEYYFEIIAKGNEYDMFDLENQMLEKVDAKNPENKEYYNNTNGGSRYTSVSAKDEALVKSLNEKLNNGDFDEYKVSTPTKEVAKWPKVQVRAEEMNDDEYTSTIAASINSKLGDTSKLPPCLSFEGWKGSSLWVDGNMRLEGVMKSDRGEDINHYALPKKIWKPLTKNNKDEITQLIVDLASYRNPSVVTPLNMKKSDWAELVVNRSKSEEQIDTEYNIRYLNDRGIADYKPIITKAKSIWKNKEEAEKHKPKGRYLGARSTQASELIDARTNELKEEFPDAIIVWGSSATFGVGNFEKAISKYSSDGILLGIQEYSKEKPKMIIPLVYHSSYEATQEWEKSKSANNRIFIEQFISSAGYELAPYRYVDLIVSVEND
jgi:hypothetical protein